MNNGITGLPLILPFLFQGTAASGPSVNTVKVLVNLTHAGPPVWFQFSGSGTVGDPAKIAGTESGAITPVNVTSAGPAAQFQFNGSGTPGSPFTLSF